MMDAPLQAHGLRKRIFASSDQRCSSGIADQFGADLGDHIVDTRLADQATSPPPWPIVTSTPGVGYRRGAAKLEIAKPETVPSPLASAVRFRQAVVAAARCFQAALPALW